MTETDRPISLQGLDRLLAQLPVGGQITIGRADFDRIFCTNDAAPRRLTHFRRGHACDTATSADIVTFTKRARGGPSGAR